MARAGSSLQPRNNVIKDGEGLIFRRTLRIYYNVLKTCSTSVIVLVQDLNYICLRIIKFIHNAWSYFKEKRYNYK